MFEDIAGNDNVEPTVLIWERCTCLEGPRRIEGVVGEHYGIDIAAIDMGASASKILNITSIMDGIVMIPFASTSSKIEHDVAGPQQGGDLRVK